MTSVRYKNDTISDLIDRIKGGDKTAFGELYDRYINTVYNKCLSFTRERHEAEDITQEIFIKVYEKLKDFDNRNFGAWLMRLTYNQCVDHSRRASKNRSVGETFENLAVEDSVEDIEAELMNVKLEALEEILKTLDPMDRSMLILKYQEDKKISELADLFGKGESAIKMRLSRARLQIIETYRTKYNGGE